MNVFFVEEVKLEKAVRSIVTHVQPCEKSGKQKPVVAHSIRIAYHLLSLGYSEEIAVIAILHDILENSSLSPDELQNQFGSFIRRGVEALTVSSKTEAAWLDSLHKCTSLGNGVMAVRVADLYDNIERQKLNQNWTKLSKYMKKLDHMTALWEQSMKFEPIWRRLLLTNGREILT